MRPCTIADFKKRGVRITKDLEPHLLNRICPNIKSVDQKYKVRNDYLNETLRNSFSIEILRCTNVTNPNCKEEGEIETLLSQIFFTLYTIDSTISYDSVFKHFSSKPIRVADLFHS